MGQYAYQVTARVVKCAVDGDMVAARLILDRVVPIRRRRPVRLKLPDIVDAASVMVAHAVRSVVPAHTPQAKRLLDGAPKRWRDAEVAWWPTSASEMWRAPEGGRERLGDTWSLSIVSALPTSGRLVVLDGQQVVGLGARLRCPWEVRCLTLALSGASGACAAPTARPAARATKASLSRRQAMGGRTSKRAGRCRAGHRPVSTCRRRDRLMPPKVPLRWERL